MKIYLPGPAQTPFGNFAAGPLDVPYDLASYLALNCGAVAYDPAGNSGLPPRILSAQEYASFKSLVSTPWNASVNAGQVIADWVTGAYTMPGNSSTGATMAADPSMAYGGQTPVKLTLGGAGTYIGRFTLTTPIAVAQLKTLQLSIRTTRNVSDDGATKCFGGANDMSIWLIGASGKQYRYSLDQRGSRANQWQTRSLVAGNAATQGWTFSGGPTSTTDLDIEYGAGTLEKITAVQFVGTAAAGQAGEAMWVMPIRRDARAKGAICLTMDGGYISQHDYALPMLESQGLKATLFLQVSLIGSGASYMTWAQVDRAYAAGHQIAIWDYDGSKGNGYADPANWPDGYTDIKADMGAAISALEARGYANARYCCQNGSAGAWFDSARAKTRQDKLVQALTEAGIKAVRYGSVLGGGYDRTQCVALPGLVDPLAVQGAIQVSSADSAATIQSLVVDHARDRGELAILTAHRFLPGQVTTPAGVEILCSTWQTFVDYAGAEVRKGHVDCLTFAGACQRYGISL